MFSKIKDIYCNTLTEKDKFWTRRISRPLSSIIVYLIKNTAITPNQITISSYLITIISGFVFVFCRTYGGLIAATLIYQLAFVLDCADGQLARIKNIQSKIGDSLDSLFDGAKALIILTAVSLRLFFIHQNSLYLILGIGGLLLVATSLMLTRFTRTEEYLESAERIKNYKSQNSGGRSGERISSPFVSSAQTAIKMLEKIGKFLIHYPSYIIYFALMNKMEWFLCIYAGVYVLCTLRILLLTTLTVIKT